MRKILLYGFSDERADRFQNIAAEMDIPVYIIGDSGLDMTLGRLFELDEDLDTASPAFPDEYMIMQEISKEELLALLDLLEKEGFPFSGIKVMRTEINAGWPLRLLLKAAAEEHRASKKALILVELLRSCNTLDLSGMEPDERDAMKKALMEAFALLDSGSYTEEDLDARIAAVTEGLKKARRLFN